MTDFSVDQLQWPSIYWSPEPTTERYWQSDLVKIRPGYTKRYNKYICLFPFPVDYDNPYWALTFPYTFYQNWAFTRLVVYLGNEFWLRAFRSDPIFVIASAFALLNDFFAGERGFAWSDSSYRMGRISDFIDFLYTHELDPRRRYTFQEGWVGQIFGNWINDLSTFACHTTELFARGYILAWTARAELAANRTVNPRELVIYKADTLGGQFVAVTSPRLSASLHKYMGLDDSDLNFNVWTGLALTRKKAPDIVIGRLTSLLDGILRMPRNG